MKQEAMEFALQGCANRREIARRYGISAPWFFAAPKGPVGLSPGFSTPGNRPARATRPERAQIERYNNTHL
jgi:transposase-like protein